MALLFTVGLTVYYFIFLRRPVKNGAILAALLWFVFFLLGLSGTLIALLGVLEPHFPPNYLSSVILLLAVVISVNGFVRFRSQDLRHLFGGIKNRRILENFLIISQFYSMVFFLPFAIASFTGDPNENRLMLSDKQVLLGSYGVFNTLAGLVSHLFTASLVLAILRLGPSKKEGRDPIRAIVLLFSSLSYVIYILAYVGRDGIVFWGMNAAMVFLVFRHHLSIGDKGKLYGLFIFLMALLALPFVVITVSRFFDSDTNGFLSILEYFGSQISNFSDYFVIERPMTFGLQNFSLIYGIGCDFVGATCPTFSDIKEVVFYEYLKQDKAPWLFATFVSDLAADFGYVGALFMVLVLSFISRKASSYKSEGKCLTLARLLLILFLFNIPYWGVFYFRLGISNAAIVANLFFIYFVALVHTSKTRY